jgi:hypothetical protein
VIRLPIVIAALVISAASAAGAQAAAARHCGSVRTNQYHAAQRRGLFGARSIAATGTGCGPARVLAAKYVENPYAVDSPRHRASEVDGWQCTWRPNPKVAQHVVVACTRAAARVTFADVLPSG